MIDLIVNTWMWTMILSCGVIGAWLARRHLVDDIMSRTFNVWTVILFGLFGLVAGLFIGTIGVLIAMAFGLPYG